MTLPANDHHAPMGLHERRVAATLTPARDDSTAQKPAPDAVALGAARPNTSTHCAVGSRRELRIRLPRLTGFLRASNQP